MVEHPSWAPAGDQLVFVGDTVDGHHRLFAVRADGSALRPITESADRHSRYFSPAWSPDRGRIAFMLVVGMPTGIFVTSPSGGKPRRLSRDEFAAGWDPAWSPDGKRLAFQAARDPGAGGMADRDIYVMTSDGKHPKRLTNSPGFDGDPVWSPDGTRIAFTSAREGALRIHVMDADGSGVRRLTAGPGSDEAPAWAPDGQRLVFVSTRDGSPALYVMNADGRQVTRLSAWP